MTSKNKKQPSHLDKLLNDKPPEFQAKVLRFALDSGMQPEDPAFRLVQYIGYLAQLTETAPQDWKQLFEELQGELEDWTELTAEQLKTAAGQKRDNQQFSNLLQQAWDSIERARFNITATVGAIEELNRNLTAFEKRRSRNPDAEKTVSELEPSIEEQSAVSHGVEPIPNASVDDLSRQRVDQDKEGGSGLSEIPEEDSSEARRKTPQRGNERNSRKNINRGFDLDL